jgi:hypothetical protein
VDQGCRKDHRIPEFSGVVSSRLPSPTPAEVVHGQSHHSATSTPRSCRLPATDQPSLWAPQPLPQRCHHHRRFPRLVRFPRSMASPNRARPAQLYSCGIQQPRRPTPAYNAHHWPATCENDHHGPPCPQFGTKRPWVQIPPPRPGKTHPLAILRKARGGQTGATGITPSWRRSV